MTQEEYLSEKANIQNKIKSLETELTELQNVYKRTLTDIREGDTVRANQKLYFVREIKLLTDWDVYYKVSPIKKDNSPAATFQYLYNSDHAVIVK